MCGICGQFNFQASRPIEIDDLKQMSHGMIHRGPDDEGYFISGALGFGFRRLSIIDLESGHQPMSDQDKTVWVVFNGEIYNFKSLRDELKAHGHVFKTQSDTEVIVHGYKQWGRDVLQHLNGMFGLAIWDERTQELLIARDPMGIKLVYYRIVDGCLYFASEMRSLLKISSSPASISLTAVNLFLRYRYTPSPLTMYEEIQKLPAGSCLTVKPGCQPCIEPWWTFKPSPLQAIPSIDEAEEKLFDLYRTAIQRQLTSDVPVGLLLSGGIDSGLLLTLMNEFDQDWDVFTVGFGKAFEEDELADARDTAQLLQASFHPIQINRQQFETALPTIVASLEEPVATASIVPMYFVCQAARQRVKVALTGQGPDELMGGYARHLGLQYGGYWRMLPNWLQHALIQGIQRLPRNATLKRGIYSLNVGDRLKRYQNVFSILPGETIDSLFQDGLLKKGMGDRILECWSSILPFMPDTDELRGFQFLELRSSLPDELLMYSDKLSMAHSLELRVPYLDKDIVEYVEPLPSSYKVRLGSRKWLHRRVVKRVLPPSILTRKKRAFASNVVDDWFQQSLSGALSSALLDPQSLMYAYLNHQAVNKLFRDHQSGAANHHKILFSLTVFENWLRVHTGQ